MSSIKDPSTLTRTFLAVSRDSKVLNRLYTEREQRKLLSYPEAKLLVVDDLNRVKALATTARSNQGWSSKVAEAKLNLCNKYIPKIQKLSASDTGVILYELEKDINISKADGSALHAERMELFYFIRAAIEELSLFATDGGQQ